MEYDLIIIGGGPAGMSAGIYASRAKLSTLILEEKLTPGGQASTTTEIENWPGFIGKGPELMTNFKNHCTKFGVEFKEGSIKEIKDSDKFIKTLITSDSREFKAKSIIIASGAAPRILGIPGEIEFKGNGVCYCATCDGEFYDGLELVVLGSGNTALEESLFLTRFATKITIIVIHEEGKVDGDKIAFEHAKAHEKINFIFNSTVSEIYGSQFVEGVKIKNLKTNEITEFTTDGIFMFVGTTPQSAIAKGLVELTPQGYIKTDEKMQTSTKGIFAAGDIIDKPLRQVVTAASDGAIAAVFAGKYIEEMELNK